MSESVKRIDDGRIIFVDNDIEMRKMMELALIDLFQIKTVSSANEGLEAMVSEKPFDIVMASLSIHGINGLAFLRRVGEMFPKTVRILMTGGFGDGADIHNALREGHISRLVLKPFNLIDMRYQLKSDLVSARTGIFY